MIAAVLTVAGITTYVLLGSIIDRILFDRWDITPVVVIFWPLLSTIIPLCYALDALVDFGRSIPDRVKASVERRSEVRLARARLIKQ